MTADPYVVLGLTSTASDTQLRAAYRKLVKLHHPDHNRGSAAAAVKFEQVQEAYAQVLRTRAATRRAPAAPSAAHADADLEARIAAIERDIAERRRREAGGARAGGPQAPAAATLAAAADRPQPASREELGYVDSDDGLTAIIDEALEQAGGRWRRSGAKRRLTDLLDS